MAYYYGGPSPTPQGHQPQAPMSGVPVGYYGSGGYASGGYTGGGRQAYGTAGGGGGAWSAGLFSCFDDPAQCLLVWCCPCIPYGKTHAYVHGTPSDWVLWAFLFWLVADLTGCQFVMELLMRMRLREMHSIPGSTLKDCCIAYWCLCCSIQQTAREVGQEGCHGPPSSQGMR
eukprot:TRINITY_DN85820_c0_g1_i1.p1 TRINITY_DN85820_c0_g1~~TRINITY_DN85820_c0_g1_i1.p1  ORF type:complete len:172 (+),score=10.82 TRINITY_DN85820_c0_g1_i1:111-626(+)